MGRNPTVFPHAGGSRSTVAHPTPRPSPIPMPVRPPLAFPAESARLRHRPRCRIPTRRRGTTAVAAQLLYRTRPAATGIRPAAASMSRDGPMAGSRPVLLCRPADRQGSSRNFRNFALCRGAIRSGMAHLRNCMAVRGSAPRIRPAAQGTPKATGGERSGHPEQRTSERKLTTCQTADPNCCVPNPRLRPRANMNRLRQGCSARPGNRPEFGHGVARCG